MIPKRVAHLDEVEDEEDDDVVEEVEDEAEGGERKGKNKCRRKILKLHFFCQVFIEQARPLLFFLSVSMSLSFPPPK